jgi:MFS family permease
MMSWPAMRGLPRAFWVLWVGTLVNRAGAVVSPFLALYLVGPRGFTVEHAGNVVALVGLGSLGAGPLGGALADRVGRRAALGVAGVAGATAMLALAFAREPRAIEACACALGLCGEMYRPVSSAIVADLVPPSDRVRAYGLLYWAVNIGFSIAPAAAGIIAATSYSALFLGDAATTLAFAGLVVALVPETRPARDGSSGRDLGRPYRHKAFVAFAFISLVFSTFFHQLSTTLPVDMGRHGISPRTFGLLLALNGVLIVLLQPFATTLQARLPRARAVACGALMTGIGFGIPALAQTTSVYALSIAVWTMGEIAMSGFTPSVIADYSPADLRGSYQGAYQLAWGAGCFLAPIVGSFVLVHWGTAVLWAGCLGVGALTAIGYAVVVPDASPAGTAPSSRPEPGVDLVGGV